MSYLLSLHSKQKYHTSSFSSSCNMFQFLKFPLDTRNYSDYARSQNNEQHTCLLCVLYGLGIFTQNVIHSKAFNSNYLHWLSVRHCKFTFASNALDLSSKNQWSNFKLVDQPPASYLPKSQEASLSSFNCTKHIRVKWTSSPKRI